MFGSGLLKGLGVTLKRFVETYVDDVKAIPSRYAHGQDFIRQTPDEKGLFTIQYPEEKRQLPERFRFIPMLLYDTPKGEDRCTACGICAKVCPPQCIWIVRDKDEKGKPVPRPAEFYIDASICMSCGFCAEFCPFDAIKMNHDYELAVYQRYPNLIYNKKELTVPLEYYASIYPTQFAEEEKRRAEEEAKKAKKPGREKPVAAAPAKPAAPPPAAQPVAAAAAASTAAISQEELERRRAEALARAAAKKAAAGEAAPAAEKPAVKPPSAASTAAISQEELERRRAEALARAAAKKGGAAAEAAPTAEKPAAKAPAAPSTAAISQEELERRRAEAKARTAARKGEALSEAPAAVPTSAAPPPAAPAAPAKPVAAAAVGGVFAKLPNPSKTSGSYTVDEIAARRAAAYERYKARKGADAKVLHGAPAGAVTSTLPAPAPAAAPPPAVSAAPSSAPSPAPAPKAAAKPPAPAAGGNVFAKLPNPGKTSGGYTVDEIAARRAAAYARYKARKGADAKDLSGH